MRRYWEYLWPARLLRSLQALAGGARVHPGAMLCGRTSQVRLDRGAIVSSGCILRPSATGQIVLGAGVWLARDVEMGTETLLQVGPRTTVQRRCTVHGSTRIGADCILAPDIFISSGTHPFRHLPHLPVRQQERRLAAEGISLDRPVWIQDDCWLGTHVVVCPGVTIGKGSVIGANSVVTRDVAPYSVMAGSPARRIAQRLDWDPPEQLETSEATHWPYFLTGCGDAGSGLRISPGEPLLVAVRGSTVRIGLRCGKSCSLLVNGQAFEISADTTHLDVRGAPADSMGTTLRIEAEPSADVVFTSFSSQP